MISHFIGAPQTFRENGAKLIGTRIHNTIGRQSSSSMNGNVFRFKWTTYWITLSLLLLLFSFPASSSSSSSITETLLLYSAHQIYVPFRERILHGIFMASNCQNPNRILMLWAFGCWLDCVHHLIKTNQLWCRRTYHDGQPNGMAKRMRRKTFANCFHTVQYLQFHLFCFPFPSPESVSQHCSSLHTHQFIIFNQSILSNIHLKRSHVTNVPANQTNITTEIRRTVVQPNATSIMHWRKTCEIIYVVCSVCCLLSV